MKLLLIAGLTAGMACAALAGGTAQWDPYQLNPGAPSGGWRYSDGSSSYYDPNLFNPGAPSGGYRFSHGGSAHWDRNRGPHGRKDFEERQTMKTRLKGDRQPSETAT